MLEKGTYAGEVIDGPWKGQRVIKEWPSFRLAQFRKPLCDVDPNAPIDWDQVIGEQIEYRWRDGEWSMNSTRATQ